MESTNVRCLSVCTMRIYINKSTSECLKFTSETNSNNMASMLVHRLAGLAIQKSSACHVSTTLKKSTALTAYARRSWRLSPSGHLRNDEQKASFSSCSTQFPRVAQNQCLRNKPSISLFKSLSTLTSVNEKLISVPGLNEARTLPDPSKTLALLPTSRINLKPRIVRQRLSKMKKYNGNEKDIRHSPWRLNLVCQFAAGLPVKEALMQLQFCQKMKAPLLARLIERTAKRADYRDGLKMSQLEVAECFATHGSHLKRIKIMGRGRSGIKRRRHSHIRLVLREIDYDLKIVQAKSLRERKQWYMRKMEAEEDKKIANAEREEMLALEKAAKEKKDKDNKTE